MSCGNFDAFHPPLTITYPNGQTAVLTYDREGENSLTNSGTGLISDMRYNGRGKLQRIGVRNRFAQLRPSSSPRITYPNGQTAVLTYDREGENSLSNSGTGLIDDIRYNGRGQLTTLQRSGSDNFTLALSSNHCDRISVLQSCFSAAVKLSVNWLLHGIPLEHLFC
jgi:hypothetical protein